MGYLVGSATSSADLLAQLATFMASNGWTLHDSISATNKVMKSVGTDGKANNVLQLFEDSAHSLWKGDAHPQNAISWINLRGYHGWNASTHVGTREYGAIGPWLWVQYPSSYPYAFRLRDVSFSSNNPARGSYRSNDRNCWWDGRSRLFVFNIYEGSPNFTLWHEGMLVSATPNIVTGGTGGAFCWYYDRAADKEYIACVGGSSSNILRYDIKKNTYAVLGAHPFGSIQYSTMVWDGGNLLYLFQGGGSTGFGKFDLSTGVWTSLTAVPASFTAYAKRAVYIPAEAANYGEDVILLFTSTGGLYFRKWLVTSGSWSTEPSPSLAGASGDESLSYDARNGYLYFWGGGSGTSGIWRSSVDSPLSWTRVGPVFTNSVSTDVADSYCGKIRGHATIPFQFWSLCNADRLVVVTKVKDDYYWGYFGRYQSAVKTSTMKTSSGVAAGSNVSVPVDDSTTFFVGEPVNVIDPSNGTWEIAVITSIPDGTHVVLTLANSYTTGSLLSADWPCASTSDAMLAGLPVDTAGYASDYQDSYARMRCLTDNTNIVGAGAPSGRNQFQVYPILLFQEHIRTEAKGTLSGVYMIKNAALAAEEELQIEGKTYKFFPCNENAMYETKQIVVGPLE